MAVNGRALSVQQAVAIAEICDRRDIASQLIHACLLSEEIERRRISVSALELQEAVDEWRRKRKLNSLADMRRWLDDNSLSVRRFAEQVEAEAKLRLLTKAIVEERRDIITHPTYEQTALLFEGVQIANLAAAREFISNSRSLDEFAQSAWSDGIRVTSTLVLDLNLRFGLTPDGIPPSCGQLLGPYLQADGTYAFIKTLSATEISGQRLIDRIIFDWLSERKAASKIEWNWGGSSCV